MTDVGAELDDGSGRSVVFNGGGCHGGDLTQKRCDPEALLKRTQLAPSHKPCVGALDSSAIGSRQQIAVREVRR